MSELSRPGRAARCTAGTRGRAARYTAGTRGRAARCTAGTRGRAARCTAGTRGRAVAIERMLFQSSTECDGLMQLMESGCDVNAPGDSLGQSPAHLAACGGQPFFLLWQLQTGLDINQQDCLGEALIHKAARSGSLECLSVLVASDAKLDVCNKNGHTAEDLALSSGFLACARYLATVKHTQDTFSKAPSPMDELQETAAGHKRGQCCGSVLYGKRRRSDGLI